MKSKVLFVLSLLGIALLAGCSTPQTRIQKNPEIFARIPAEQQELIKQGKVAIGFDADMVRLAVGDPDRKWTRTDESGTSESWSYTTFETGDGMLLYRGFYHRYYGYGPYAHYYTSYPSRREREYFKVVFKDGRVTSIEQETR